MKKRSGWSYVIEKQDVKSLSNLYDSKYFEEVEYRKNKPIRKNEQEKKSYIRKELEYYKDNSIYKYPMDRYRYKLLANSL